MRSATRVVLALLSAAVLAASVFASAATAATTYQVLGFETAATSTTGTFSGLITSEPGTWQATIAHGELNKAPGGTTTITGGTFAIAPLLSPPAAGAITAGQLVASAPVGTGFCTQQFAVTGNLVSTTGRTGTFQATLTHYGFFTQGVCNAFFATVSGSLTLS